jgi:hypothetical protein
VNVSVRRPLVATCALVLLAGCGPSGNDAAPADSAEPTASSAPVEEPTEEPTVVQSPTLEPTPEPTAEPTASPTPTSTGPAVVYEPSECKEPKLDTDGVELVAVRLARTGDTLTVTFTDDQAAPETRNVLWSVWVTRADEGSGPRIVQLGAEISDGDEIAHFVFAGGRQTNISAGQGMKVSGKKTTATFPASAVTELGPGARWYATLTVEQETKDYCPGGRGVDREKITGIELPASWF